MFDFFTSFFKELNSASNKTMISLAVVLGFISGLLPSFTLINYLILFFVFIFRIPLGLYFASFSVFKLFSYLFDPIFNKIGYMILTSKSLEPFFTYLYNLPVLRWSGFNNTLVMGSLVVGILGGVVLFFVLNKLVDKYREKVFPKLKKIKLLSWIVPKEEKKGIIRLSGVFAFFVVFGSVGLVFYLFLDDFLKVSLQKILSKSLNKKVLIKEVKVDILKPKIEIKDMQIDTFLVKEASIEISYYYLLWKKLDIKNLIIEAKTNNSILSFFKEKAASKKVKENKFSFEVPKAEDILKKQQLKSEIAIKKLKSDYNEFMKFYKEAKKRDYEISSLKNSIDNLDLKKLKELQNRVKKLKVAVNEDIEKLNYYKKLISEDIKNLKEALKEDKQNISSQFNMVKNKDVVSLSQIYLKPEIAKYIKAISFVYEKIEPFLSKKEQKEILREGIYIKFEDKIKHPDFLLENAKSKLITSISEYRLFVKDLADNQKLLGRFALIDLIGDSRFYKLSLKAKYFEKIDFNLNAQDIKPNKLKFDKLEILHPLISLTFNGSVLKKWDTKGEILFEKAKIILNQKDKFSQIINKILKDIDKFKVFVKVKGDIKNPSIEVSSDLDKIISNKLNEIYKKELEKEKTKALNILDSKVNSELKKYKIKASLKDVSALEKEIKKKIVEKGKSTIKKNLINKLKLF